MKIKTRELTGAALDWAVAMIESRDWKEQGYLEDFPYDLSFDDGEVYSPSTDWAQGGPVIEREKIDVWVHAGKQWSASKDKARTEFRSETPLIAAMRCYVASKLGDEVEIPQKEADHVLD